MKRKRRRSLVLFALGLVAFAGVALGWSMWTYAELVRLQVRLADTCARVDAAGGVRLGLVSNLLQGAQDFPVDASLQRLEEAREALADQDRAMPFDGRSRGRFEDAHRELTVALSEFWAASAGLRESAARAIVSDLRPELERATAELEQSLTRMNRDLGLYDRSMREFPGYLVAGFAEPETPAVSGVVAKPPE